MGIDAGIEGASPARPAAAYIHTNTLQALGAKKKWQPGEGGWRKELSDSRSGEGAREGHQIMPASLLTPQSLTNIIAHVMAAREG